MPSPFLHHDLVRGVPSGVTYSFLQERGETGVQVYQEDMLQGVVKRLNMAFLSGLEWVLQQDSVPAQKTKQLRSSRRGTFWPSSAPRIGFWGVQTSNPEQKTVGCFGGHGVMKASQQPREPKEIPCDSSSRDPPGDGACGNSIVAGASRGLRRDIGRPF